MTDTMPRVGLDVHPNQTPASMLDLRTGELQRGRIQGPPECALEYLAALEGDLIAVYEARPTGFALARAAFPSRVDRAHEVEVRRRHHRGSPSDARPRSASARSRSK
jgi:hypothetical protein